MQIRKMEALDVYLISGLGADKRLFEKLQLPESFKLIHIDWISPRKNESIHSYALRLSAVIDQSRPFYLVGVSFGGMVASEMTTFLKPMKTIIISSASSATEIPWYYKLGVRLKLHKLLPITVLKYPTTFINWFFGADTFEERKLMREILNDTDGKFLRWAMGAIGSWKTENQPKVAFHIHGNSDNVIPIRYVTADHIFPEGKHLIVYSQAETVSKILTEKLGS